jgi:hypothetical protein
VHHLQAIDSNIFAVLISAVVAFVIVFLNTFVLEPRRRRAEEKELRKQQLSTWSSDMKSNLSSLQDHARRLYKLDADDRPLDRLALKRRELVRNMTDVRRRILDLNELLNVYNRTLALQLQYMITPDPLKGEPYPTQQGDSGEIDRGRAIKNRRDNMLQLIDYTRAQLLPKVKDLIDALEAALQLENEDS